MERFTLFNILLILANSLGLRKRRVEREHTLQEVRNTQNVPAGNVRRRFGKW
jgi:hypothetical protein